MPTSPKVSKYIHSVSKPHHAAFTIVELLVVIVVIAILAAISIVAYTGIQNRANEAVAKSDLRNAATQLELDRTTGDGNYPDKGSSGGDLPKSDGTVYQYSRTNSGEGYCLSATRGTIAQHIVNGVTPAEGVCAGHTPPNSDGSPVVVNGGVVTVFAGSGVRGSADGQGTAAQFDYPEGLAIDSAGTVYVADGGNDRIRKISPSGQVTTLAGSTNGYADGQGAAAQFNDPTGIDIDAAGNVIVADQTSYRIRKVTPGGTVSTLAGSTKGVTNGQGATAQFWSPYRLALDPSGNVYVSEVTAGRIRKVTPSGAVTTLAGGGPGSADGTGASAQFNYPGGIHVSSSGTIYVLDNSNSWSGRIRKVTPSGQVTSMELTYSPGVTPELNWAEGGIVVAPSGVIYLTDSGNDRILKVE